MQHRTVSRQLLAKLCGEENDVQDNPILVNRICLIAARISTHAPKLYRYTINNPTREKRLMGDDLPTAHPLHLLARSEIPHTRKPQARRAVEVLGGWSSDVDDT